MRSFFNAAFQACASLWSFLSLLWRFNVPSSGDLGLQVDSNDLQPGPIHPTLSKEDSRIILIESGCLARFSAVTFVDPITRDVTVHLFIQERGDA